MATYPAESVIDGQPTFSVPLATILGELEPGGAIQVLSPREHHTARQRKWYKGVCLKGLADWNGDTPEEWDLRLKALCGGDLLRKETLYLGNGLTCRRPTIVGVGRKNMTQFIENILSKAIEQEWPATPPDADLRKE